VNVYRWVDHTAEVELAIAAADPEGVLAQALCALAELIAGEREPEAPDVEREIAVCARDEPGLFAAWLEELVYLAESEGFIGEAVTRCRLSYGRLTTTVAGRLDAPRPVVKAVTYHRLAFGPRGKGYVANVVLDV
jgi:SHS2 domain-containing protein